MYEKAEVCLMSILLHINQGYLKKGLTVNGSIDILINKIIHKYFIENLNISFKSIYNYYNYNIIAHF